MSEVKTHSCFRKNFGMYMKEMEWLWGLILCDMVEGILVLNGESMNEAKGIHQCFFAVNVGHDFVPIDENVYAQSKNCHRILWKISNSFDK